MNNVLLELNQVLDLKAHLDEFSKHPVKGKTGYYLERITSKFLSAIKNRNKVAEKIEKKFTVVDGEQKLQLNPQKILEYNRELFELGVSPSEFEFPAIAISDLKSITSNPDELPLFQMLGLSPIFVNDYPKENLNKVLLPLSELDSAIQSIRQFSKFNIPFSLKERLMMIYLPIYDIKRIVSNINQRLILKDGYGEYNPDSKQIYVPTEKSEEFGKVYFDSAIDDVFLAQYSPDAAQAEGKVGDIIVEISVPSIPLTSLDEVEVPSAVYKGMDKFIDEEA